MAIRYDSLTGEYIDDDGDGNVAYLGGPNISVDDNPYSGYDPAQPSAPAAPTAANTASAPSAPNYRQQITDTYQQNLGRAPTAAELSSDLANAQKYGTSGSLLSDIAARASNTPGTDDRQATSTAPQPSTPSYSGSGTSTPQVQAPQYANDLIAQLMQRQQQIDADNKARADALYGTLTSRINQSLTVDRNDPVIRAQSDAFSAQQDRSARNYISDLAERSGPYANLEGARRMEAEHTGQASGAFEANLMGQELQARRAEIAQALSLAAGTLTAEQTANLQRQLGILDNAIRQQSLGVSQRGQDLTFDQFLRSLALNEWDRNSYWSYANTFGL